MAPSSPHRKERLGDPISLDVWNVAVSVQFYQKVFSVTPQKQTADERCFIQLDQRHRIADYT